MEYWLKNFFNNEIMKQEDIINHVRSSTGIDWFNFHANVYFLGI